MTWTVAEVVGLVGETPEAASIALSSPGWDGHLAGQHIDLRLTAEDGYQAQRRCSIATPADGDLVTITVERASTLVALGHAPERIRTERFGPTGG